MAFYAFVLGTDEYPPFTLDSVENYPADLHVDYPESLENWRPLVKWFLAFPHYLLLGFTSGGGMNGLMFFIALFVGVGLLFTGKYHRDFFRIIMGVSRWNLRVFAYAGLLTDEYPHFRIWESDAG